MKKIRNVALLFAIIALFTVGTLALDFVPSIQYKDEPDIVESDDNIIITPVADSYDTTIEIHEDINASLNDAKEELGEWKGLVEAIADTWKEITGGAPVENAVVSDIFDVRFEDELGKDLKEGKPMTVKFKILGLDYNDKFFIITKENEATEWKSINFTIDENGVITLTGTSMSVFAVIRDNYANVAIDPDAPDSPQTGVASYVVPAIAGVVLFSGAAFVFGRKLKNGTAA